MEKFREKDAEISYN